MKNQITATIKDQVYHILKNDICTGTYQPGHWLQENDIADRLGVSRSPVREALRMLANDGLVVENPNKGVFVREFTAKDISDIFDFRVMMEDYAIKHSAENLTEQLKVELLCLLDELETAHRSNDLERYIEADNDIHCFIIGLSGNKVIESTYERIGSMTQPFRIYSFAERGRFDDSVEEHRLIVEAIIRGDTAAAASANREHLTLARDQILCYLSKPKEQKQMLETS